MAPAITQAASGHDIPSDILSAVLARDEVLGSALERARRAGPEANLGRTGKPHDASAVVAAARLGVEGEGA